MSTAQIIDAALALPAQSKAELVERLLASLESGSQSEIDAAWAKEADNRIAAYEAGEIEAIPAEQVLAELRARRK